MISAKTNARLTQATALVLTMGSATAVGLATLQAAHAQGTEAPTGPSSADKDLPSQSEIVVTAPHLQGAVETDVPAELELDETAIESYGASSITELLDALSPQTTSGGRGNGPVILLNNVVEIFELAHLNASLGLDRDSWTIV